MKADLFDITGKKIKSVDLPKQFDESYEPDLVNRAVLAIMSHKRQSYGTAPLAGQGYSAKLSRRRRDYKGAYGKGISRVPRKTMWRRGMQFGWVGTLIPGTVGGRRAHPPKAVKLWGLKINNKERKKAIRSALSGAAFKSKVVILENNFENLKRVKDAKKVLNLLGFTTEAVKRKKAGRGKSRMRSFRYKKNPLIIVGEKCELFKAISNIPGYDIMTVKNINASALSLGFDKPRDCIFTENALNKLNNEKLFFESEK